MYRANSRQADKTDTTDTNPVLAGLSADREFSWQRPRWYW